ncbi:MAG: LiaI-LiaF-like domain-containing protein [Terriglobales bacterium]
MEEYKYNPACGCSCCRRSGLTGPVMMVTIGTLFLIANYTRFDFGDLWPVILIVMGGLMLLRPSFSRAGHLNPGGPPTPPNPTAPASGSQNPSSQVQNV